MFASGVVGSAQRSVRGLGQSPTGANKWPRGGRVSPPAKSPVAPPVSDLTRRTHKRKKGAGPGKRTPPPKTRSTRRALRPVLAGNRVDALVVAFQVALDEGADDELEERQAFADLAGRSELTLAGLAFCIRRNRSSDRFCFENADARCFVDRRASGGWMLEVVVRAVFLAAHSLDVSLALLTGLQLGWVKRLERASGALTSALTSLDSLFARGMLNAS